MSQQPYLTADGAEKMRKELEKAGQLWALAEIAKRLRAAIEMGDLSENADYSKAKEDQAFLEGRIQELEYLLHNAVIIEKKTISLRIVYKLASGWQSRKGEEPETYHLVGKGSRPKKRENLQWSRLLGKQF